MRTDIHHESDVDTELVVNVCLHFTLGAGGLVIF